MKLEEIPVVSYEATESKTMKKSKHTPKQIVYALKQNESGETVASLCRKLGVSEATFYNWKKKFNGLGVSDLRELRQLREENSKLKRLVADLSLDKHLQQDVLVEMMWIPMSGQ